MESGILAFEMPGMDVQIHQHAGFQIVYAFENLFATEVAGNKHSNIRGFIIKPQMAHLCSGVSGKVAIVNIEPDSTAGRMVANALGDADLLVLYTADDIYKALNMQNDGGEAIYTALRYLRAVKKSNNFGTKVQQVIDIIRGENAAGSTPASLAAAVHLSHSRLSALFKEKTGSSLSKFILWTRLRRAIQMLLTEDTPLGDIAYEAGFYDSPNFTKYMHKMIGVPPIAFRKKSDLIQVI